MDNVYDAAFALFDRIFELKEVDKIADLIETELKNTPCVDKVDRIYYRNDHCNVLAHIPSNGPQSSMMFIAHLDCREITATKLIRQGDVISANGTFGSDDRAGVVALLTSLEYISRSAHGEIYMLFTDQEEKGCLGAVSFFNDIKLDLDYVFALDANDRAGCVYVADYLACSIQINFYHNALLYRDLPERSDDAISISKSIIYYFDDFDACSLSVRTSSFKEWIAFKTEIYELLTVDPDKLFLHDEVTVNVGKYGKLGVILREKWGYLSQNEYDDIYDLITPIYNDLKLDIKLKREHKGGSDATIAAQKGYNALTLGSGAYRGHARDEQLYISDIVKNVEIIRRLCGID